MSIGKAFCASLLFGLASTLSAIGADTLKIASFSTVLTEIAHQVGGNHVSVAKKKQHVKAIFLESMLNQVSVEITTETGAKIGGTLYADALGEGDGAPTTK
jgi:ABC-type Zn uptake system ZnuABC Zn-binding protein ZnuA